MENVTSALCQLKLLERFVHHKALSLSPDCHVLDWTVRFALTSSRFQKKNLTYRDIKDKTPDKEEVTLAKILPDFNYCSYLH